VNGAVYEGQWNRGKKHGNGVFTYPDGSKYDGTIKTRHVLFVSVGLRAQSVISVNESHTLAHMLCSRSFACFMFLPHDAMRKRGTRCRPVSVRLSVCHTRVLLYTDV